MSPPAPDIYEHDVDAASDEAFEAGTLGHLAIGNRGRMLDPRRTPVTITDIDASRGIFGVRVEAFEDVGASWQLPLEDVSHFQFERGAARLKRSDREELERAASRFDQMIHIPVSDQALRRTMGAIEERRALIRPELAAHPELRAIDIDECVRTRRGARDAAEVLNSLIESAGLARLEQSFAETYVSNPRSGEIVKGHSIVIAEMGLCPYSGKIVRDDRLFEGDGTKERRHAHIVLRLAFMQELLSQLDTLTVELYRGIAVDGALGPPRPAPLVAATFSREIAMSHFESPAEVAVLLRQRVPVSRLFMTFLETLAMNERYHEAEAVLIGAPANLVF
jgi:hypothetical protein